MYDDLDKKEIQAMKTNYLREIVIKERKTKAPLILLYSKNHAGDDVEKLKYEQRTPGILKKYWSSIEKSELERKKTQKVRN